MVLQVETAQAVEQAAGIAAVDGVDVVFIGPADLSQSLGLPGQTQHPAVQDAMHRVAAAVTRSPAALGVMVGDVRAARAWRDRGARYITVTLEAVLGPAARGYLAGVREGTAPASLERQIQKEGE